MQVCDKTHCSTEYRPQTIDKTPFSLSGGRKWAKSVALEVASLEMAEKAKAAGFEVADIPDIFPNRFVEVDDFMAPEGEVPKN